MAWLVAYSTQQNRDEAIEIAKLNHLRALTIAATNRNKASNDTEKAAYQRLISVYTGEDYDPEKIYRDQIRQSEEKYEEAIGMSMESEDFKRKLASTLAALAT